MLRTAFILATLSLLSFNSCIPDGQGEKQGQDEESISEKEFETVPDSLAEEGFDDFRIVPRASVLQWRGERISGEGHQGTVDVASGNIRVRDQRIEGGQIWLDMTSMKETGEEREEETSSVVMGYLHSQRFFDTEKFPKALLTIKGESQGMLLADLKIKDNTRAVMIPFNKSISGDTLRAGGSFAIDRTKWGLTYRSAGQTKDLGSLVIKDSIFFRTKVVAITGK
jgi:polyisoprenoid-binding protein YceI